MTTKASLWDGGMGEARTDQQTLYLNAFTASWKSTDSMLIHDTFPASTTQQTLPLVDNMAQTASSSHAFPSPLNSDSSSLILMPPPQETSSAVSMLASALFMRLNISETTLNQIDGNSILSERLPSSPTSHPHGDAAQALTGSRRWGAPILPLPERTPRPYKPYLSPLISPLRPHCTALQRLVLWRPLNKRTFRDSSGRTIDLNEEDITRLQLVLA